MLRTALTTVTVLVLSSVAVAADPKPTPAEAAEIKQLSEDIFGLATRKKACEKLGDYGPKAWAAIPNLTELLTEKKERDASVLVAAATALGKIGGAAVVKTLSGVAARHEMAEVRAAALAEVIRIAPTAADAARLTKSALTDSSAAVRAVAALALLRSAGKEQPPAEAVQVAKALLAAAMTGDRLIKPGEDDPTQLWLALRVLGVPAATAELQDEIQSVLVANVLMAEFRGFPGRGFDGLGLLFGIPPEEMRRRGEEVDASHEKRHKLIVDAFLAGAEEAGPGGRVVLARAFLRAGQARRELVPAAPGARVFIASLRNNTPFERAKAAAALAAVEKEDQAEAIKSLEAALKDDSPLVVAVAKETLTRLAKK